MSENCDKIHAKGDQREFSAVLKGVAYKGPVKLIKRVKIAHSFLHRGNRPF